MDRHRVRVKKHSRRMRRKSIRNKEAKIYITVFLVCVAIAGTIFFLTGRDPAILQKIAGR